MAVTLRADDYRRGQIVDGMACASDPAITYAYYLPARYTPERRWPILYIFDPRQRGAFAAELFREAAEDYGWILVSSNNTRSDSDLAPNVRALEATIPDAQKRFAVDRRRIYTTGFSGGAILAWAVAQTGKDVAGVIGCSGRPGETNADYRVAFDWFGTAGIRDFNYLETLVIDRGMAAANASHRLEIFDGAHRWAPREVLRKGVEWMELQAMKHGTRPRDDELVKHLFDADVAAAGAETDALSAVRRYETIARTFDGLENVDAVRSRGAELRASPEFRRAVEEENRAEKLERSNLARFPEIINGFLRADEALLAPTLAHELRIAQLQQTASKGGYLGMAAQRVLESIFVQLDFYLVREVSGQKLIVTRRVAALIHPQAH